MTEKSEYKPESELVYIKLANSDKEIRIAVMKSGGKRDMYKRIWKINKQAVIELGLERNLIKHSQVQQFMAIPGNLTSKTGIFLYLGILSN